MFNRRRSRVVKVRDVQIGGDNPVVVQTMASECELEKIIAQIHRCAERGCKIIRVAFPSNDFQSVFAEIVRQSPLPIVADIHFDWRLALAAIKSGAAKIRINPGNITDWDGLKKVIIEARMREIPIRIGLNGGSVKTQSPDDQRDAAEVLVEKALGYAKRFEELNFSAIALSLKSSSVIETITINRRVAAQCDYPLHLGLTEAGLPEDALLKSATTLGALLADGIGDTVRVSFTGEPEAEIDAAYQILRAAGVWRDRPELISCPTCGRTRQRNLPQLAKQLRAELQKIQRPLTVALMGCEVNGPGEAAAADIGLAAAADGFWLFIKGQKIRRLTAENALSELLNKIRQI